MSTSVTLAMAAELDIRLMIGTTRDVPQVAHPAPRVARMVAKEDRPILLVVFLEGVLSFFCSRILKVINETAIP